MAMLKFIAMIAGEPQTSVSVHGQTFDVKNGFVEVPDTFEREMLTSGFKRAPNEPVKTAAPVAAATPAKTDTEF